MLLGLGGPVGQLHFCAVLHALDAHDDVNGGGGSTV
jgi:hypothetical protein